MSTPSTSTKSQIMMSHIFCVAQQFTSVTVYVLGKKIMATVDVYHLVFIRLLFVVRYSFAFDCFLLLFHVLSCSNLSQIPLVFVASSLFTRKLSAFKIPLKTWGYIAASGVIGIFISQ